MARTLNPTAHAVRRDAFVDAAQRLIEVKGYEQMSVQDVLDELDASKGAFYHYFDSKADLLEAVVERMIDAATTAMVPLIENPRLTSTAKLEGMFAAIASWKGERSELMLAILEVWLADDNTMVREKFRQGIVRRLAPLLARIVEQGKTEGAFTTGCPEHAGRVLVSLVLGLNETATELFFARQAGTISFADVEHTLAAYTEAFERVLGVHPGSLTLGDPSTLRQWFG